MREVGENIKRNNGKATALANKIANSDFMQGWLIDNQQNFVETMNLIRDGAPVKWAELYMKAYQMGIIKESNINININRQQDRADLQALVRTRVQLPDNGSYTPYEEVVQPEKLPLNREEKEL